MAEALLDVQEAAIGYTEPVLGPVSFQLEPGEILGLVGPNGSGKSTLLKAISNNARLFAGEISLKADTSLSWMEQHPVQLAEMPVSGWEYLHFAQADAEEPPAHLADWLEERSDAPSRGQKQG